MIVTNTAPPPVEPQDEMRDVYRFCADAISTALVNHPPASPRLELLIAKVEKTMRGAAAVPPIHVVPDLPVAEQPTLSTPAVAGLAVKKVNGSTGSH